MAIYSLNAISKCTKKMEIIAAGYDFQLKKLIEQKISYHKEMGFHKWVVRTIKWLYEKTFF